MDRVGRYEILESLGSGGTARVDLARMQGEANFTRVVAVKRLHARLASNDEMVDRFHDEAMLASRIRHPNVVSAVDVLRVGDSIAIVYDLVIGVTLRTLFKKVGSNGIPTPFASRIAIDMLEGLHAAHTTRDEKGRELGIVHRDVSPANVIIDATGVAKVIDFGLATARVKLAQTKPGDVYGTVPYLAPERLRAQTVDARCDVYSASVVLWEMLSGRRLFEGTEGDVVWRILQGPITTAGEGRSDVSPALAAVVAKGLERAPNRRYASAREMALAIEHVAPPAPARAFGNWIEYGAKRELEAMRERVDAAMRGERVTNLRSLPPSSRGPHTETIPPLANAPIDDDTESGSTIVSPFPSHLEAADGGRTMRSEDTFTSRVPEVPTQRPPVSISAEVATPKMVVKKAIGAHATSSHTPSGPPSNLSPAPVSAPAPPIPYPSQYPPPGSSPAPYPSHPPHIASAPIPYPSNARPPMPGASDPKANVRVAIAFTVGAILLLILVGIAWFATRKT